MIIYQGRVYSWIPSPGRRKWGRGNDTIEEHSDGRWTLEVWPDNDYRRAVTREIRDPS